MLTLRKLQIYYDSYTNINFKKLLLKFNYHTQAEEFLHYDIAHEKTSEV